MKEENVGEVQFGKFNREYFVMPYALYSQMVKAQKYGARKEGNEIPVRYEIRPHVMDDVRRRRLASGIHH
jgi:hypothetical protein